MLFSCNTTRARILEKVMSYSYSSRHRMHESRFPHKEGDYVSYISFNSITGEEMIGQGEVFKILEGNQVIIKTGNGAQGLEYVNKKDVHTT